MTRSVWMSSCNWCMCSCNSVDSVECDSFHKKWKWLKDFINKISNLMKILSVFINEISMCMLKFMLHMLIEFFCSSNNLSQRSRFLKQEFRASSWWQWDQKEYHSHSLYFSFNSSLQSLCLSLSLFLCLCVLISLLYFY